ncbi:adenylate/guanylate cyclase domain-containing protein [Sinorhizobium meliloti]|uniref:adenylate/guanylate cyclase domain-containing protein n=1 Tax=Rhizobium meliloti TaxID=382 RepID=UPI002380A332|nr:tetratricopeptide repeat protein [Sinorhizobium meliloti]MDE3820071.1 tetratricopeptide repeat protein [Sinorhizobium meliloti]
MVRHLAAILIADVVGYSRLSQIDEEGTRAHFQADLTEIFEPRIAAHHGRLVKTMGDGILVEFRSIVDALRCAVEIQQQKAQVNELIAPERRLDFRIGINVGDVLVEDDDIHGDAVNIADRLQGLAEPGGIAISAPACDQVRGKLPVGFACLGEQKMKNIAEPVQVYRVLAEPAAASKIAGPRLIADDDRRPPVIAVLPFENLSSDDGWTRLADGLSADMIADLARYPDLAVISRQTMQSYRGRSDTRSVGRELNANYLLEGTLQAMGQKVRVVVQLVDARTGADLWSARFEESTADFFVMQDSVTQSVINALAGTYGKLAIIGREVARRKLPSSLNAYDCYLLGAELHDRFTIGKRAEAIRTLSRAVELDPSFARAWMMLGLAHAVDACYAFTRDSAASVKCWRECIEKALVLDPVDPMARLYMGDLRGLDGDLSGAAEEYDRVLTLAPNNADTLSMLSSSRALVCGDPDVACALAERALRLNPQAPSWYYAQLARARFVAGRYAESLSSLRKSPSDNPVTLMFRVLCHGLLGEPDQAKTVARLIAVEFPRFTVENFIRTYPVTNPPALAAIKEGARRTGME